MSTAQAAFQAPVCQDVSFSDHARQAHGIFERQRVQGGAKADAFGALRRCGKHGQRVRGYRELLEEVMIDD